MRLFKSARALLIASCSVLMLSFASRVGHAQMDEISWLSPQIAIVWPHDGQGHPTGVGLSVAVNVSIWPTRQVFSAMLLNMLHR